MHVAPMAKPDDGAFDVLSLGAPRRLAFAWLARKLYDASHLTDPNVAHFTCDAIDLALKVKRSDEASFPLDIDGEPLGSLPAKIALVPRALRVCVA
jgi:diacylglycerol kinase family enzyme